MTSAAPLHLTDRHLDGVLALLHQQVPDHEVWAYGSRVSGGAFDASDLDLVVRNPADLQQPCTQLPGLRRAFVESNLPIHVDVVDWASIPDSFRQEIIRKYVVLQTIGN